MSSKWSSSAQGKGTFHTHAGHLVSILQALPWPSPLPTERPRRKETLPKHEPEWPGVQFWKTASSPALMWSHLPPLGWVHVQAQCQGAISAAGVQGTEVESLHGGWAAEMLQNALRVIAGNAALFGNSGTHKRTRAELARSKHK